MGWSSLVGIFLHSCKKYDVIHRPIQYMSCDSKSWYVYIYLLFRSTFDHLMSINHVEKGYKCTTTFSFFDIRIFFYFFKKSFLFVTVVPPSTEDLRDSRCGSNLSLLQEGANSLHYSNPTLLASPPTQWVKISKYHN